MFLFIQSQEIGSVTYGMTDQETMIALRTYSVPPEKDLFVLDTFLQEQNITMTDIAGIILVTGPGSFTASRISVTMANTIAFVLQIPIFEIKNEQQFSSEELLNRFFSNPFPDAKSFAVPTYGNPPNITFSHS